MQKFAGTAGANRQRTLIMRRSATAALTLLALLAAAPLLGACHTTAGVGEDVSATGNAVTNEADRHTP
jgi:predicted small secreted protein